MTETLAVIAILAILAGLAVPAVAVIRRQLHMAELDAYARQIFLAAQNEVTAMKASGRLDAFAKTLDSRLTVEPSDFPETDNEAWRDLYVVTSEEESAVNFLLRASDSLRDATEGGGSFLLEVNPLSGDVYSVFYAQEEFTYNDVLALADRSRESRQNGTPQLGYYGGGTGEFGTVGMPEAFYPTLTVVNGEELYVTVDCGGLMALRRTQRYLSLTLTVADEHDGIWERGYQGGVDFFVENDSISISLVLDSLDPALSFKTVTGLTSGDDLTITATVTYADQNNAVHIQGSAAEAGVSSLFGGRDETGGIAVSRVRHLNNLRQEIYNGGDAVQVIQTQPISFAFKDWEEKDYCSHWTANPLGAFTPIENHRLFAGGGYDGRGNALQGFVIVGAGAAGLFGSLTGTTLENVRLTDCTVKGRGAYTGTLAGRLTDCTVAGCGAYLNTHSASGQPYSDMEARRTSFRVSGSSNVGGLIGLAENCKITGSFAAVDAVASGQYAGGLAGRMAQGSAAECYASGNVTAVGYAGGLTGLGKGAVLEACYASGGVTAESCGGGLAGSITGSVRDCVAYGRVLRSDGEIDTATSGGLAGKGGGSFSSCRYLQQAKYNAGFSAVPGVSPSVYALLRTTQVNDGDSYPYAQALQGTGFPFALLTWNDGRMPHYGDWPEEYQMQNSLVYYERYKDGGYGYYARTSLTAGGESAGGNWVVDTLRDETCLEDGYAILTVYALRSFTYTLETGVKNEIRKPVDVQVVQNPAQAGRDQSPLIQEKVTLLFQDQDTGGSTSISNAKVYRLPFDLQITERTAAETFWQTLRVTGYAALNGQTVMDGETFYYCPDFAKNAVNPESGATLRPNEPGGGDSPVYVRSARQLNGLARAPYYWNERGGGQKIQFIQETDIDFAAYTKTYCGTAYDLMDTRQSNPYRNKPIGRPNVAVASSLLVNNFRNSYDGQGHRIIDYCCDAEEYQFTGLFGEVQSCILKNIVLEASSPEAGSAYVKSTFDSGDFRPGVGALVGLVYVDRNDSLPMAAVENCAVSGYTVAYTGNTSRDYAVGGLAGFNFGRIQNCSAVSALVAGSGGSGKRYVGGLVGSMNGYAAVTACYAGGSLASSGEGSCGGISGGFENIYGQGDNDGSRKMTISASYSYCTLARDNVPRAGLYGVAPPVDKQTVADCWYLMDAAPAANDDNRGLSGQKLAALSFDGSGRASAESTHPWSEDLAGRTYDFPAVVQTAEGDFCHYGDWPAQEGGGLLLTEDTYFVYYERYADKTWGIYTLDRAGEPLSSLDRSGEKDIAATGYGALTRSGSFSLNGKKGTALGRKLDGDFGAHKLYSLSDSLESDIVPGYWEKTVPLVLEDTNEKTKQTLYVNGGFGAAIFAGSDAPALEFRTADQLQNAGGRGGWTFLQTHDIIIPADAASRYGLLNNNQGGSVYDGGGHTISGLKNPLFSASSGTLRDLHLTGVRIDSPDQSAAGLVVDAGMAGSVITDCSVEGSVTSENGAAAGLVLTNGGIVTACRVEASVTGGQRASGFVDVNNGVIRRCGAAGDVTSESGSAAGFVRFASGGRIESCCAAGDVEAEAAASGFFIDGWGQMADCYTTAEVSGDRAYYGFGPENRPVTNCRYTEWKSQKSSGSWCYGIDWSAAVDKKGIPTEDWPKGIQIY